MPFFNFSTTTDPAMIKKGWVPICAVLAVAGLALFSAGNIYGSLRSDKSLATTEILSSLSMSVVSVFPDIDCDKVPEVYQGYCGCIKERCTNQIEACYNDDACKAAAEDEGGSCYAKYGSADPSKLQACLKDSFENPTTHKGVLASNCIQEAIKECD